MLALAGTIVTFDPGRPIVDPGVLYVGDDGLIVAVAGAGDKPPTGFGSVTPLETKGVLYPGLIDLHSHILYNLRTLWTAPVQDPFDSHDQWPGAPTYFDEITAPAKVWAKSPAARHVLAFAMVKALVGGTTAIQGAPGSAGSQEGFLARIIDSEAFGTGKDPVSQSVGSLPVKDLKKRATSMGGGTTFVYHLAEGTTAKGLQTEYKRVVEAKCLVEQLVAIHATALDASQYAAWTPHAGSIVWSPFSNLWLYRATTDVVAADQAKLRICIGSDWGPSGSKNVLGELKVADLWNKKHLGGHFSDLALCQMVTTNPADALGDVWSTRVGRLKKNLHADVVILDKRNPKPYRNLIESTEQNVRLVLVEGKARYGDTQLMKAAGAETPWSIPQAGAHRSVSLAGAPVPMTWRDVLANLKAVRDDPVAAVAAVDRARSLGEETFELIPDMPEGPTPRGFDEAKVTMPPLDTLRHDDAFFRRLQKKNAPILDGLLDGLSDYYKPSP